MNKDKIYKQVLNNLVTKFPNIKEDTDIYDEAIEIMKQNYELFNSQYTKKDGDFETFMVNALERDACISLELETIEVELSEDELESLEELENITDIEINTNISTYSEKYKNIEKIISKGSGPLTSEEKDILAAKNIPLIHSIVKRFANTGIEYSELLSAGYVGYAKALQTFAKGKNVKFSTYAYRCIKNEILYFLRREKRHKDNDVSLFKPMSTDKNGNVMTVDSTISTEDMGARSVEEEIAVSETVQIMMEIIDTYLSKTEALIIKERYGLGGIKPKTQKEIADEIGMSQANVSKLEKGISDKIKKIMSSKYKIKSI